MKTCGKILVAELPLQTSAENMIRRMLKIVRDEYMTARLIKENEERNLKENEVSSPITPSNWEFLRLSSTLPFQALIILACISY